MAEEASGEEERHQYSWSELPSEVLSLIFSHLFLKSDHDIFGAVCKSWKSAVAFHSSRPLPFEFSYGRSPFLMTLREGRCDFFHPTHTSYYLHVPELLDKRILDSKYGWLLVEGTGDEVLSIFFFHPLTKEKIGLPDIPSHTLVSEFSFYSLPTSSEECKVVAMDNSGVISLKIFITKPREENWTRVHLFYEYEKRFLYGAMRHFICCTPVFHNGKCYCLDHDGKVAVFDLKDIENSWGFCGKPYSKVDHRLVVQSFMVESDEELLTVFLSDEAQIWICKLNPVTREWTKVEDLGNKVLYLSNGASWVERTMFEGMGNKIYLPIMCPTTNNILFYSLATGKFHCHGHDFSRTNFYDMKQLHQSTWIEPWY